MVLRWCIQVRRIFTALSVLCTFVVFGQYNNKAYFSHEVGIFLGGSYYLGDLNPSRQFFQTQPAVGAFYRFNYNYRIAFRAGFNYGSIQGDDSQSSSPDQLERNLNFKSKIEEVYVQAEFNFWEFKVGHKDYIFAPYIFLGVAGFHFNPMGNINNQWVALQPLSTEGQGTILNPSLKPYKLYQMSIPFGLGFKLSFSKMIGIAFEWGPRKTFTDYLDDVSGAYVDPAKLAAIKGQLSGMMSNRSVGNGIAQGDVGKMRGNPATKDWYFYYGFVISIKLPQKPKECKGVF